MSTPTNEQMLAAILAKMEGKEKASAPSEDTVAALLAKINAKEKAEETARIKAAEAEAMDKRVAELIAKATGEERQKLEDANVLIVALNKSLDESKELFAKSVKDNEESIEALKEQVKALTSARHGRSPLGDAVAKSLIGDTKAFNQEVEDLVLLSMICKKGVFETSAGAAHLKAVNESSSMAVSSEAYETIFNTNILRDIQKELRVANLFPELVLDAANITFPIQGGPLKANWVDASTYGTDATTGPDWQKDKLTEITFNTFKLSAKAFITDETREDTIIVLLPLIRANIIESHAVSIEEAFMSGTGLGQPEGLLTMAKADGMHIATEAKFDGSVKVTAKQIHALRAHLKSKGLNLSKLALVVSLDAYYDLTLDEEFQDVSQVEAANAVKLTGQVGRIYGLPIIVSEFFPEKAAKAPYALIVYIPDFLVPRQRGITVEDERKAESQRNNIFVTQRLNLQRKFKTNNIVVATYA